MKDYENNTAAQDPGTVHPVTKIADNISFDLATRTLEVNGVKNILTKKESQLLWLLVSNTDELVTREMALTSIWDANDWFNSRSMDVYVCKLRKRLKSAENIEIINEHGKGHRFLVKK